MSIIYLARSSQVTVLPVALYRGYAVSLVSHRKHETERYIAKLISSFDLPIARTTGVPHDHCELHENVLLAIEKKRCSKANLNSGNP